MGDCGKMLGKTEKLTVLPILAWPGQAMQGRASKRRKLNMD